MRRKPCIAGLFEFGMINSFVPLASSRLIQVPGSMIHEVMSEVVRWQNEIQENIDQ